jgi:hypothetical protein
MNARLERKLRLLAAVVAAGAISGVLFNLARGRPLASAMVVGGSYGLVISFVLASIELFVLEGPMRGWLSGLPFAASLAVRSAIYATITVVIQWLQVGEAIAGLPDMSHETFWLGLIYSVVLSVVINLAIGISSIVGHRDITGRSRKIASYCSSTSPARPDWPSGSAGSAFIACSMKPFVCSPSRSWITAARSSIMSATR